jgi:hypothetical protein
MEFAAGAPITGCSIHSTGRSAGYIWSVM